MKNAKCVASLVILAAVVGAMLALYQPGIAQNNGQLTWGPTQSLHVTRIYYQPSGHVDYAVAYPEGTGYITALHDCGLKVGDTVQFRMSSVDSAIGTQRIEVLSPSGCPTTTVFG